MKSDGSKVKVLYFDHTAALGGGERSLLDILENLDTGRYEPLLVTPGGGPLVEEAAALGVRWIHLDVNLALLRRRRGSIHPLRPRSFVDATAATAAAVRLSRLVRREGADIIHSNSQKAHFIAALAARWSGTPFVWHARDILSDGSVRTIADVVAGAFADAVVAVSEAVAGQFRVASPRVRVVYNGIDVYGMTRKTAAVDRSAVRKNLSVPESARLVVNIGQLSRWKGQDVFLRAARAISRDVPDTYFVVVGGPIFGENGYASFLRKLAGDLGIGARVAFTGQTGDVSGILAAADVMLHTPVEPEPFGRVVVEAMAAGVPVVAARCGGVPEIITDGTDGILFPPRSADAAAAATTALLRDPVRLKELSSAGRRRAGAFDISRTVCKVEELYEELILVDMTVGEVYPAFGVTSADERWREFTYGEVA